jgi:hypothetical protein
MIEHGARSGQWRMHINFSRESARWVIIWGDRGIDRKAILKMKLKITRAIAFGCVQLTQRACLNTVRDKYVVQNV